MGAPRGWYSSFAPCSNITFFRCIVLPKPIPSTGERASETVILGPSELCAGTGCEISHCPTSFSPFS